MTMYQFLLRYFPRLASDIIMSMWYTALILLVLYCAFEPKAEFSYLAY